MELLPESKLERLQFDGVSATSTSLPPTKASVAFFPRVCVLGPCPSSAQATVCTGQGLTLSRKKPGRGQTCCVAEGLHGAWWFPGQVTPGERPLSNGGTGPAGHSCKHCKHYYTTMNSDWARELGFDCWNLDFSRGFWLERRFIYDARFLRTRTWVFLCIWTNTWSMVGSTDTYLTACWMKEWER